MEKNKSNETFLPVILLIVFAAITRFLPHPNNVTAVGAIALFSGANFRDNRYAFLIPIAVLFITDIFIGFHFSMLPVYSCFAFTVFMGTLIKRKQNIFKIVGASLLSSIVFFLVTNLPLWYIDQALYPNTFAGTMKSYQMALPFFRNQLLGDLFFNGVLFGVFHLLLQRSSLSRVKSR